MIYISSSEKLHDDLKYNITTMLGKTIAQGKLNTRVSVEWMTPGTYHLEILSSEGLLNTITFIKM